MELAKVTSVQLVNFIKRRCDAAEAARIKKAIDESAEVRTRFEQLCAAFVDVCLYDSQTYASVTIEAQAASASPDFATETNMSPQQLEAGVEKAGLWSRLRTR